MEAAAPADMSELSGQYGEKMEELLQAVYEKQQAGEIPPRHPFGRCAENVLLCLSIVGSTRPHIKLVIHT